MSEDFSGMFINYALSLLLRKIQVPTDFHNQTKAVKEMLKDDVSGLVDSLTDFAVQSASVNYNIETENEKLNKILRKWLDLINIETVGVPTGINPLAEEYFKERWKSSSFPILKMSKWENIGEGIIVPTEMFIVDGGSVHAKDKDSSDAEKLNIVNYDYFLGNNEDSEQLNKNVIITKPYSRWYDKYPTPYLIKRGVYHNFRLIQSLKEKQSEILDVVVPYMLLIKKGTENLYIQKDISYNNEQLTQLISDFQTLVDEMKTFDPKIKAPIRATNFDEELKHFLPDLSAMFKQDLFINAEKGILTGLGFIDVADSVSQSRRESILNPKGFTIEVEKGVKDFKQVLKEMVLIILQKNKSHIKYTNKDFRVTSSPVTAFMTKEFKDSIRQLWDRGKISHQTAVELIGEVDFRTEVERIKQEQKEGLDLTLYPNLTDNREGAGLDLQEDLTSKKSIKETDNLPDDKVDPLEKQEYNLGSFEEDDVELEESAYKPEITENYIRLRQIDPKKFQEESFRTITLSKKRGIKAIIGRLEAETKSTIQSYLFAKDKWETKDAQDWVKKYQEQSVELVGAPYKTIKDLPPAVKDNLDIELQRVFMRVFNNAYNRYDNETIAFKTAWSVVHKLARKNKSGKWIRKAETIKGKKQPIKLTRAMVEESIEETEEQVITEAFEIKNFNLTEEKKNLLKKLTEKKQG